jgi:hypothetical protein
MLQAAQRMLPECSFEGLTAVGLGLVRMQRTAAAAAATGQTVVASSIQGQHQPGCGLAVPSQQVGLWEAWFARSFQLLQQDPKIAAQLWLQPHVLSHQQYGAGPAGIQPGGSTGPSVHLQEATAEQQQQQQRVSIHCADISLQLFIAAHLRLAPPAAWSQAALAATSVQLQGMSLEQLSWVVWTVARLGLGPQLPPGWLHAVLQKASSLPVRLSSGGGSGAAAAMLRLGKSVRRLRGLQCVQQQDWQLWLLLAQRWNTAQAIVC